MRVDLRSATRRGGTSIRSSAFPTARFAIYMGAVPLKRLRMLLPAWIGLSLGLSFAANGAAVQARPCASYSFINEDGIVEMSNAIRPALADRGYSCLAKDGTVLEVVPPKRTADAQAKPVEKVPKETGPHPRTAEELRKLYASAHDVEEARDRAIAAIDEAIALARANLEIWKLKLRDFEATAAAAEREGQSPSAETLDNLDIVRTQIEATGRDIEARRIEKRNAIEQFELDLNDIERFYPAAPEAE
jgi:hypothetical protein